MLIYLLIYLYAVRCLAVDPLVDPPVDLTVDLPVDLFVRRALPDC